MAEVSSGMSAAPVLSNVPTEESTPIGNTFNESHPLKRLAENIETEVEGRKLPKDPRISCEYLPFPPTQGFYYPNSSLHFWPRFRIYPFHITAQPIKSRQNFR
jgi:hypothetical protein